MTTPKTINVLIERVGEWWVAKCVEQDLVTQARTLPQLHFEIQHLLLSHIESCERLGREPFQLPPAPADVHEKFQNTPIGTTVVLPMPPIEVSTRSRPPEVHTRIAA